MLQNTTATWRLVNPREALWQAEAPRFEALTHQPTVIATPTTSAPNIQRTPLIFVHGMEYYSREEILRDLVIPFERHARCFVDALWSPYDVYVVHWDSRALPDPSTSSSPPVYSPSSWFANFIKFSKNALHWRTHLAMIEGRARTAARNISPAIGTLLSHPWPRKPLVVTHSLGSLVWSEVVKTLLSAGRLPRRLGTWWNMQPALPWNTFNTGGEYECIAKVYADPQAHMSIWYSKLDIVLSTLFVGSKRTLAMGQVGAGNPLFEHCNLTSLAREAHGQTIVLRGSGTFFARIGDYLTRRAASSLH